MTSPLGILYNRPWQLTIGTLVLAVILVVFGRGTLTDNNQPVTYVITVVPSDALNLNCALSSPIGGERCGFDDNQHPQQVTEPLRPYVTTNRELLLLKGVFETKAVAAWYASAISRHDDSRVTLECRAVTLGIVSKAQVRWSDTGAFQPEENVMAAIVRDCSISQ